MFGLKILILASFSLSDYFVNAVPCLSGMILLISFIFWIQELLMSKLNGCTDTLKESSLLVNFNVGPENPAHIVCFNPLHQFNHIGKKKLDQVC